MNEDMVDQVLEERDSEPAKVKLDFYEPEDTDMPMMPVEFAVAAYRFGHSMIRPGYTINKDGGERPFSVRNPPIII